MRDPEGTIEQESRAATRVTAWTAGALLAVMWAGVPWLAPLAASAPLAAGFRSRTERWPRALIVRWVVTVVIVGGVLIGLVGDRAVRAVPFGANAASRTAGWLEGTDPAVPGVVAMLIMSVAFVLTTIASRGLLGCVVIAGVALRAAVVASVIYGRSTNLFDATVAAFPAWTLAWLAGAIVMFAPLSRRGVAGPSARDAGGNSSRALAMGAALLAASVLLRLTTASIYAALAHRFMP